jgi:hypothetical protein
VGRRLFEGVSEAMVMNAIEELPAPAPSLMTPRYPADLERIVMRGLSRDRKLRYQTAEEMRIDLEEFARAHKLDVTAQRISSFVRSLAADSRLPDSTPGPTPAQLEWERAARRAQTPPEPRGAQPQEVPAAAGRSRRAVWFVTLGLLAVAGFGTAWLAGRHGPAAPPPPAPAVPVIGVPSESAPAPAAKPPAAKPPAPIEEDLSDPAPPSAATAREHHRDRGGGHKARPPHEPAASTPPTVEKWAPDPAPASR